MHAHNKFIVQDHQIVWLCVPIHLSPPSLAFPITAFLIATSSSIWQNKLLFDFQFMGLVLFGLLLFSVIFWWPFVFKITHKLSALTATAENIAEGNFKTPIETGLNDEIDRLSAAIKSMALRLDSFVQRQKRFLGDISHELITPLAKLDMALELFDTSNTNDRTELIADIKDEVREMNLMVNELLAFAKAGLQSRQTELEPVSVLAVVRKAISRLPGNNLITVTVDAEAIVLADPTLLLRAISNVLRNSIRYAGDAGPISVQTTETQETISIVIKDKGPGVPEEILSILGEPFFRAEFSRNRDSGGVGLGLAMVKSCIECCQGQVLVSNHLGGGLQTQITLKKALLEPI
jgi:two-component system sensor histidine kinase CpxA